MTLSLMTCTCDQWEDRRNHHIDCDLWNDDEFAEGSVVWDARSWSLLVDFNVGPRTEEDWEEIYALSEYDLVTMERIHLGDFDDDEPVEAEVVEATVSSTELRCLCVANPSWLDCDACGVARTTINSPWYKTTERRAREAKMATLDYRCWCQPEKDAVFCRTCEVQRWSKTSPWTFWDPDAYDALYNYGNAGTWYSKCRHQEFELVMPDGTCLYPSSHFKREPDAQPPDLGVYLSDIWTPTGAAFTINWPDFGVPAIPIDHLDWMVRTALNMACEGWWVEVGCIGGHGRTGTFLALCALHCGAESPEAAIDWVREHYCTHAIEGEKQEWFVARYDAWLRGVEPPPPPPPPPPITKTVTTPTTPVGGHPKPPLAALPATTGTTPSQKGGDCT